MFVHLAQTSMKVPKFLRQLFFFFRSRIIAIPLGFFVVQTKSLRKKLKIIFSNTVKQQFQDEESVEKNWNSLVLFDYKKLGKLSLPIHIFHGEKDILIPPQQVRELLSYCPNATFDIIPHAGHMPPVETPETLAHLMEKYFK
jgi:pimeloyl-ACP methyl ester carboxylesterase